MREHVGVEVYHNAFSTTTLNGSEFELCAGGFNQQDEFSPPTVQDVMWNSFVAILHVHVRTKSESGSRRQKKKGRINYILTRFIVHSLHKTL
jgi:hypothetical protein